MLKTVECFKCSDGKVFENKKQAEIYEGELLIAKEIENFVVSNMQFLTSMDMELVVECLSENVESLETILNIKGMKM
jgi:hypothetical protein